MKEPHIHQILTNDEADNLCAHYRRKGYNPVKSLNINPQYFDVTVYLPVVKYLKPTP